MFAYFLNKQKTGRRNTSTPAKNYEYTVQHVYFVKAVKYSLPFPHI